MALIGEIDKEMFLAVMFKADMTGTQAPPEYQQVSEANPDWLTKHNEILQQIKERSPSPTGRRKLNETGTFQSTKGEEQQDGNNQNKGDESEIKETLQKLEVAFQTLQISVEHLEQVVSTTIKVLDRFDQALGNNILVMKKEDTKMGRFYGELNKLVPKLVDDHGFRNKISKATSAGPVVNIETKTCLDLQAVRDKTKALIEGSSLRDSVFVIQGSGPMAQIICQLPRALKGWLMDRMREAGKEEKITVWCPWRSSVPGFSLHANGRCIMSASTVTEELVLTLAIDRGHPGKDPRRRPSKDLKRKLPNLRHDLQDGDHCAEEA